MTKIILTILLIPFFQYNNCNSQSELTEIKYPILSDSLNFSYFNDIKFIDSDLGYLLFNDKFFITTDLGENFSEIKISSKEDNFQELILRKNILALITSYGFGNVYTLSTDGGNHWFQNDTLTKFDIQFLDGGIIYGMYYFEKVPTLYYSENAGLNWKVIHKFKNNIENDNDDLDQENKIYFLNKYFGFYYGRYNVESEKGRFESTNKSEVFLFKTIDGGLNWEKINSLNNYNDINQIQFLDNLNGYTYCKVIDKENYFTGYLLKTTDGGLSWKEINTNEEYNWFGFKFINSKDGWIYEKGENKFLRKTTNGGQRFEYINIKTDDFISNIECLNSGVSFLVYGNRIYKTNIYNNSIVNNDIKQEIIDGKRIEDKKLEANELYKKKNYKDALSIYKELIETDNYNDFIIYFNSGYCSNQLKQYDEAIYYYEKALSIKSIDYITINNLGVAFENISNYEIAKKYYEEAISIDSTNELAQNNLKELEVKPQKDKVYQYYNKAYLICIQQSYNSYYYNTINFDEINKAIDYCRKGLELNAGYESSLKFILNSLEMLLQDKELHPDLYK